MEVLAFVVMGVLGLAAMVVAAIPPGTGLEGPQVGDGLQFQTEYEDAESPEAGLQVVRSENAPDGHAGKECRLTPGDMARSGGSMMVVARDSVPSPRWLLEWRGAHTSADPAQDCGPFAAVWLDLDALGRLSRSAGPQPGILPPIRAATIPSAIVN